MGSTPAIGSKKCSRCLCKKPLHEFAWRNSRNGTRQPYCNDCRKRYDNEWYKNHPHRRQVIQDSNSRRKSQHREKINELKNVPCADCGVTYAPHIMDFDHIDEKNFNISGSLGLNFERVLLEISKCEIVCANCHRERTWNRLHP